MTEKAVDYTPQTITLPLIRALTKADAPDKPREVYDKTNGFILRHQPSGTLTLYANLGRGSRKKLCDARRIIDSEATETLSAAKTAAKVLRGEVAGGRDLKGERDRARSMPTLRAFIDEHYRHEASAATIGRLATNFTDYYDRKLTELTPAALEKWRREKKKKRTKTGKALAPESINRELMALSGVLSYALEIDLIDEHPLRGIRMEKVDRHKVSQRALTADEKQRLLDALAERDAEKREQRASAIAWRAERGYEPLPKIATFADVLTPAVVVSLETGVRRGELFALEWPAIDFDKRSLHVAGKTAKSRQTRDIPMSDRAYTTLRDWWLQCGQPKRGYVFPGKSGAKLDNLKKSYHVVLDRAGIERVNELGHRVTWHSLRHTFATLIGARTKDATTLQALLGHASLTTTQKYLHTDEERKAKAVALLAEDA